MLTYATVDKAMFEDFLSETISKKLMKIFPHYDALLKPRHINSNVIFKSPQNAWLLLHVYFIWKKCIFFHFQGIPWNWLIFLEPIPYVYSKIGLGCMTFNIECCWNIKFTVSWMSPQNCASVCLLSISLSYQYQN